MLYKKFIDILLYEHFVDNKTILSLLLLLSFLKLQHKKKKQK